jgi:hypothetical protein
LQKSTQPYGTLVCAVTVANVAWGSLPVPALACAAPIPSMTAARKTAFTRSATMPDPTPRVSRSEDATGVLRSI